MAGSQSLIHYKPPRRKTHLAFWLAAILTLVALGLAFVVAVTFQEANRLMRLPPAPLEAVSGNVLPAFQLAGFRSLDDRTPLSGWYFPAKGSRRAVVVLVHDQGHNRLQFGYDTAYLYQDLVDAGFAVLAFDLRHSGDSGGPFSTFGYGEWRDVLAAMAQAVRLSGTDSILLYGFGSGGSACAAAYDALPPPGARRGDYPAEIAALPFNRSIVRGMILDSPGLTADDAIRAAARQEPLTAAFPFPDTLPLAIRLSAQAGGVIRTAAILSRMDRPLHLAYHEVDRYLAQGLHERLAAERSRLQPGQTTIFAAEGEGYCEGFMTDRDGYLAALHAYLDRYFP